MVKQIEVSMATKFPLVASEWHPTKNSFSPFDVRPKSHKIAWFVCCKGHEYQSIIANRTNLGRGCPYCSNNKVYAGNCLATLFPEIAAEWHPTKNSKTPFEVIAYSAKKAFFLCPKHHEWEASIEKRTLMGRGCPYCCNQRACMDNCLATLFPEVAAEWHPTLNGAYTPYNVVSKSNKRCFFLCGNNHTWGTKLVDRTSKKTGCPKCKGSEGEKRIRGWLQKHAVPFLEQHRFPDCIHKRSLPFDFFLPEFEMCIEYDGAQHFEPHWTAEDTQELLKTQLRDSIKTDYCKRTGIYLLRIPYTKHKIIENVLEIEFFK